MGNPFGEIIDTSIAPIEGDAKEVSDIANKIPETLSSSPTAIAKAAVGTPVSSVVNSGASAATVTLETAKAVLEDTNTAIKSVNQASEIISNLPTQIHTLANKMASGQLKAGSDAFKQANANILGGLDLSRTVLPGYTYSDGGQASALLDPIRSTLNKVGLSVPSQIPIPTLPLAKAPHSDYNNLPAWGSVEDFGKLGTGTNFYWGVTLDNDDMDGVHSFAPPNPFEWGQYPYSGLGYTFNTAFEGKDPFGSMYIPAQGYSLMWRKNKTSGLSVGDLNLELPSGFSFPESINIDIFDTDKYEWELYLRRYYDTLTGCETNPFPYKNCCSRIGLNVFYGTGKLYMQQMFYCIPDLELQLTGDQNKSTKTYSMSWKVYGEGPLTLYSFEDKPRPMNGLITS